MYNDIEVIGMMENANDFMSLAVLIIILIFVAVNLFNYLNGKRVRKHIEEEYFSYTDFED